MKRSPETSNSVFYPHSSSDVSVGGRFYMMDAMGKKKFCPLHPIVLSWFRKKEKYLTTPASADRDTYLTPYFLASVSLLPLVAILT